RVRGKHARVARRSGQALAVELQVLDEDGRRLQAVECVVDRRKEGWFVLLKIAVVRQRQALQRGGERDERTERSGGTAAEAPADSYACRKRTESRSSGSACARRWCPSVTACARCRCV